MMLFSVLVLALGIILGILPYLFILWFFVELIMLFPCKKLGEKYHRQNIIRLRISGIISILFMIFLLPYNSCVGGFINYLCEMLHITGG